jgi:hypothetical protein
MNGNLRIGFDRACKSSSRPGRVVVAMILSALICPLAGCSFGGSASGEGTVDIARAKEATKSNPDLSKSPAARNKGGLGGVQKTGRR